MIAVHWRGNTCKFAVVVSDDRDHAKDLIVFLSSDQFFSQL